MDDRFMYSRLPLLDQWLYKNFQCRIVDEDSDPGECYKTAAFVISPDGTLHRVPITMYNIEKKLIELWIDAGCPMDKTWYSESDLTQIKSARENHSPHGTRSATQMESDNPCIVLGVSNSATIDDITTAYRKLAMQYHPDKVASLAFEFKELAERRMKAINGAYEILKHRLQS